MGEGWLQPPAMGGQSVTVTDSALSVSIVIPARNEAANLPWVLSRLPVAYEAVLVDGHSTDATVEVARSLRPDIVLLSQLGRGKGDAIVCGVEACGGDVVVTLDADGSADPAEIPRFLRAIEAGADLAKGSRRLAGGGSTDLTRTRRCGNAALKRLVNSSFGTAYTDLCYGMNAFRRDRAADLGLARAGYTGRGAARGYRRQVPLGYGFEIETLMNIRAAVATLVVTEVPSFERPRLHGQSNLNVVRDGLRVLQVILAERSGRRPRPVVPLLRSMPAGESWTEVIRPPVPMELVMAELHRADAPTSAGKIRMPGTAEIIDLTTAAAETAAVHQLLDVILVEPTAAETDEIELPA